MIKVRFACLLLALVACRPSAPDETAAEEPTTDPPASEKPSTPAAEPRAADKKERTDDGYEVIRSQSGSSEVEVKAPPGWKVAQPPSTPDPRGGKFTLKEALKDLPGGKAPLVATLRTNLGSVYCDLFEDKAPNTVANFVGLARGLREVWSTKEAAWVAKPYYDGTTFHRVIPGFMIQGGDFAGDGTGEIWYTIPDEVHPSLKHDRAGQLCMANKGPNTNAAQFFITEGPAPHLDGSYTIFGQCIPTEIVNRIARVPQAGPPSNRPLTPVVMERVTVERRAGGANAVAASGGAPAGGATKTAPATGTTAAPVTPTKPTAKVAAEPKPSAPAAETTPAATPVAESKPAATPAAELKPAATPAAEPAKPAP